MSSGLESLSHIAIPALGSFPWLLLSPPDSKQCPHTKAVSPHHSPRAAKFEEVKNHGPSLSFPRLSFLVLPRLQPVHRHCILRPPTPNPTFTPSVHTTRTGAPYHLRPLPFSQPLLSVTQKASDTHNSWVLWGPQLRSLPCHPLFFSGQVAELEYESSPHPIQTPGLGVPVLLGLKSVV